MMGRNNCRILFSRIIPWDEAGRFHLHYLNDAHNLGGHLLDYKTKEAKVYLQVFESVETHFPVENEDFMKEEFDIDGLRASISSAEK